MTILKSWSLVKAEDQTRKRIGRWDGTAPDVRGSPRQFQHRAKRLGSQTGAWRRDAHFSRNRLQVVANLIGPVDRTILHALE